MRWRIVESKRWLVAHSLDLTFEDGTRKRVDLLPLLEGPVFERVREPVVLCAGRARSGGRNGGVAERCGHRPRNPL